jgi:serine/threonine-protein kinase RsbW
MGQDPFDFVVRLPPDAEAPALARRMIGDLQAVLPAATLERATLLASELVTNSVRHGATSEPSPIAIHVQLRSGQLRVEIRDGGPGFDPSALSAGPFPGGSGYGLTLVERLADRWGVDREDDGATAPSRSTAVWFELGAPGTSTARPEV